MSRFTKIIIGLIVVGVAVVVSLGVMLKSSDFSRVKVELDRMVERATGREFVIAGDLEFNLSLTPSFSVSDVHLANAKWGSKADMMVLRNLEAQVDLMSLFKGQLNIDYIVIDGLELHLETDGQGLTNWEFAPLQADANKASDAPSAFKLNPTVRDVRLKNIYAVFKDGATGMTFDGHLKGARFKAEAYDAPIVGGFVGELNGVTLDTNARLGSLAQIISAEEIPFPFSLQIDGPDLSADLDASMGHPGKGLNIEARLQAKIFDPQVIGQLLNVDEIPAVGQVDVRSKVHMLGDTVSFNGLELKTKDTDVAGMLSVKLSSTRPSVEAQLRSDQINLTPFVPEGDSEPQGDKVFSQTPISLSGVDAFDANVEFTGGLVKVQDFSASDVRAKVKLKNGAVDVRPASLIFDKGRIDMTASLVPSSEGLEIRTQASVRNLNAGTVTKLSGQGDLLDLLMDGEVLLITKGRSPHDFAKSANGHVKMIGRNGRINDKGVVGLTESVTSILPWVSNKDANAISCVLAEVPIADGLATAKTVVVDTSGVTVNVTGKIDLGQESLGLEVNTDAKSTSLASFAVPFQVNGTLKNPKTRVKAGEAVVGTLGNIVKTPAKAIAGLLAGTISLVESSEAKKERKEQNDPCVQALKGGKTAPTDPPKE